MNRISTAIWATCLLAIPATVRAQDCSAWNNMQLAGTYTMSGSGYVDLSKALPVPGMPSGLVPMFWVGATVFDGAGGATGWVSINAAGNQMTGSFVNKKYAIKPDCTIQVTYSLKINELQGLTVGPFSHLMVPVVKSGTLWMPADLELHMITVGASPGAPAGALVDSGVMYRISIQH
ncbi:MAG TPA: hypothetical protein VLY04_05350 [Bryobacteraceae bacterium]|nr:hypothetical protein [Bryobacteraceae bacterium]